MFSDISAYVTVSDECYIASNFASGDGGALYNARGSEMILEDSTLSYNGYFVNENTGFVTRSEKGGALVFFDGGTSMKRTTFHANQAKHVRYIR